ncbi:hypothetical protein BCR37DRAFT_381025 [Protomyces lactucae-debilis]|uniref:FAS1 domain-containing protein n=1 Tax=Protomyces lactucae-debilis TaxID=2754530 RepID=A0A1Y2F9P5_PROLT|nr:uncharacterized protein BCR37DRAFT_381025 [Protomyces lactucae-debilis]ORY80357.1 hypothetical protein BCR37DRAFT_381025 [Protomyces lactucae-debilis]
MKLLASLSFSLFSLYSLHCAASSAADANVLKLRSETTTNMDFFADNKPPSGKPTLSDIMDKRCTIINDYMMGSPDVMQRLQDDTKQTLILAPLNAAIIALPQKPWISMDSASGSGSKEASSAQRNEENAEANIARFVKQHVVAQYPLTAGVRVPTMNGGSIWFEEDMKTSVKRVYPGGHRVVSEKQAANGAIWIVDGIMQPATEAPVDKKDGL